MQSTCAIRTRDRRLTATEGSFKIHEMTQDEEIKSALWQKQIIATAEAVRSQTFEKGHVLPPPHEMAPQIHAPLPYYAASCTCSVAVLSQQCSIRHVRIGCDVIKTRWMELSPASSMTLLYMFVIRPQGTYILCM